MTTEPQQARKNPFAFKKAEPAAEIDPRADNIPDASQFALDIQSAQPVKGYTLGAVLASSDRTAIFKSHDAVMDRPVVVKMMRPFPGRDGVVEEFFSLAGSIARLRCTGVARGLDVGRADGNFYLVYEFLTGEDLDKKLAKRPSGKMTERESARLVREIALVLQELFTLGQPHGYLKPSNIMIADSRPRLADIGFAWSLAWPDDDAAFLHAARYLPPERLRGEINIDVRGDLYSLGAIWFRCLTGRDLFDGDSPEEMVRKHCEVRPPTAKSVDPKFTEETSKLIRWLLEKDRDNRPRTPKQFLRHLAAHPLLAGDVMDEDIDDGEALQELPDSSPEAEDAAEQSEEASSDSAPGNVTPESAEPIEITTVGDANESVTASDQTTDPAAQSIPDTTTVAAPAEADAADGNDVDVVVSDETAISIYNDYASASHYAPGDPDTGNAPEEESTGISHADARNASFSTETTDATAASDATALSNITDGTDVTGTADVTDAAEAPAPTDPTESEIPEGAATGSLFPAPTTDEEHHADADAPVSSPETNDALPDHSSHTVDHMAPEKSAEEAFTTTTTDAAVAAYHHYAKASQAAEQPYE